MIATLSADRGSITMRAGDWSHTIPAAELPRWLAFYRALKTRGGKGRGEPGPYAAHYAGPIAALERVEKVIKAMETKR